MIRSPGNAFSIAHRERIPTALPLRSEELGELTPIIVAGQARTAVRVASSRLASPSSSGPSQRDRAYSYGSETLRISPRPLLSGRVTRAALVLTPPTSNPGPLHPYVWSCPSHVGYYDEMEIIPVLDIAAGVAVYARARADAGYVPCARVVARSAGESLRAAARVSRDPGREACYVADSMRSRGGRRPAGVLASWPTGAAGHREASWWDAGAYRDQRRAEVLSCGAATSWLVSRRFAPSRTCDDRERRWGPRGVVFSLDLRLGPVRSSIPRCRTSRAPSRSARGMAAERPTPLASAPSSCSTSDAWGPAAGLILAGEGMAQDAATTRCWRRGSADTKRSRPDAKRGVRRRARGRARFIRGAVTSADVAALQVPPTRSVADERLRNVADCRSSPRPRAPAASGACSRRALAHRHARSQILRQPFRRAVLNGEESAVGAREDVGRPAEVVDGDPGRRLRDAA